MMPRPAPSSIVRSLWPHAASPTPLAFFSPSSHSTSSNLRPPYFTPARSLARFSTFTPSFSRATSALCPAASQNRPSPSHFSALRTNFRRDASTSWSSPSSTSTHPVLLSQRTLTAPTRAFSTSASSRGIRPYLGRGRGRQGYGSEGGGGGGGGWGPRPGWKQRLDGLPGVWVIGGLIAVNTSIFLLWNYSTQLAQRFRDTSLFRFMSRNFTVSWQNLSQGRIWTLFTSVFSHEGTSHILVNMLSLWFMGGAAAAVLGNTGFLALYLFSGVVGSTFSALFAEFVTRNEWYSAHGASGAVFGCASFFACAFPKANFLLFFVLPVPAWLCVGGLFAWDLWNGLGRRGGTVDSMGHVGGAIAGALFFLRKIRRI
ncbi:hypothetical protein JCM11641_005346 [Rhodosporidiobolus odoratus]